MITVNDLPTEILPIVASYLPPSDAIQLNNICKKFHSKLSLTVTAPHPIISEFSRYAPDGDVHYGFLIPVPSKVSCHSMHLSMIWKDQGWGNCKGQLFIVAEGKIKPYNRTSHFFGGGRLVYTSATASHGKQDLAIEFQPKDNETYHVWYTLCLSLSSVNMQALVFDDTSRCYGNAFNFLMRTEALPTWDAKPWTVIIHLDVEEFVITHEDHLLTSLISFQDRRNVSDTELWRKLKGFIQSIWKSRMEEYCLNSRLTFYRQLDAVHPLRPPDVMQVDVLLDDGMDVEKLQ